MLGSWLRKRVRKALQPLRTLRLRDPAAERRFEALAPRYAEVVAALAAGGAARTGDGGSTYAWSDWEREILDAFRGGVPRGFLATRRIRQTMVFERLSHLPERLEVAVRAFGPARARALLREDAVGRPRIAEGRFLTSANRAHHAYHLAQYRLATGRDPWAVEGVVEWGGGYGNLARLFRRMAPGLTYTVVDLAPLLALQWLYLSSLEGEAACHLVTAADPRFVPGKVNLVESASVTSGLAAPSAELFVSTWAATESPPAAQDFIARTRFFGARRLLIGYLKDENNRLAAVAPGAGCQLSPVTALEHEGFPGHEYAFR